MNTNTLIQFIIGAVVLWIIFTFLVPLLPGALHTLAVIVLVLIAIIWLLRLFGLVNR